jgi:hypothetical protein
LDSNSTKPKWEIRLPQLLNTTVGPDRPVILSIKNLSVYIYFFLLFKERDFTRRHTAQIVLQQEQQQQPSAFIPQDKEVELIFFFFFF